MRTPQLPRRFAMSLQRVRILGVTIAVLLAGGVVTATQTPVDERPVQVVAAAPTPSTAHELDLLTEIQEAIAVNARYEAALAAERQAKADADAKQARLDQAKAKAARASRQATIRPRHASGNCTTGSANPGVADPCGCESSDVQGWSPGGKYYGKYQYGKTDWAANGGDPAKYGNATEAEQDAVAANTHYDAWPNC